MLIKQLICLCSGILFSGITHALNLEEGVYAGVIIGGSWAPSIQLATNPSFELNYDVMGLVGGQIGYRWDKIRAEAEFFYNSNTYSNVVFNDIKFTARKNTENFYTGQTNVMFGMLNLYYDLLPPANTDSNFAPFVGIGGGYGSVQNTLAITYNSEQITPGGIGRSHSSYGGQVIGGLMAFLDDFSYFMLDVRFFSTPFYNQTLTLKNGNTQNISYQNQIVSVNLSFNGVLDLG